MCSAYCSHISTGTKLLTLIQYPLNFSLGKNVNKSATFSALSQLGCPISKYVAQSVFELNWSIAYERHATRSSNKSVPTNFFKCGKESDSIKTIAG